MDCVTARQRRPPTRCVDKHAGRPRRDSVRRWRRAPATRATPSRRPPASTARAPPPRPARGLRGAPRQGLAALADQPTDGTIVGSEVSPYGPTLGVAYPRLDVDAASRLPRPRCPPGATPAPQVRAAVCVEIVDAINRRSFEMANAVMHTSAASRSSCRSRQAGRTPRTGPSRRSSPGSSSRSACRRRSCGRSRARTARATPPRSGCRRTTGSCRAASPSSSAATPSRRGTATPACSPRSSPATRSSSSRTRGPCCRSRSRSRRRDRCSRDAGFDPALVQLAAEADGRGPGQDARRARRGRDHRLHRRAGLRRPGSRRTARRAGKLVYTEKAGVNSIVVDSTDNLRGHARQPRVLADALLRPDVHDAAEHLRPARRHRDRRGPPVLRGVRRSAWPRPSGS